MLIPDFTFTVVVLFCGFKEPTECESTKIHPGSALEESPVRLSRSSMKGSVFRSAQIKQHNLSEIFWEDLDSRVV